MSILPSVSVEEIVIVENEAQILSNYLVDTSVDKKEEGLYLRVVIEKKLSLSDKEERLWRLMLKSKVLLSSIDAGLAILNPNSAIRERICIMLAIVETHPAFFNLFIANHKSTIPEWSQLLCTMALTPVKAIFGITIIKFY